MRLNEERKRLSATTIDRPDSVLSNTSEPVRSRVGVWELAVTTRRRSSLPSETQTNTETAMATEAVCKTGLRGNVILNFYNMWKYTNPSRPLGKRKVELPNSMKLCDKYRQCGCVSRSHIKQCRISGCCSYP